MKRVALVASLAVLASACGGSAPANTTPNPNRVISNIPAWFSQVPDDPNIVYSAKTATSQDLQQAANKAILDARAEIAAQMATRIQQLSDRFVEETGLAQDAQMLDKFSQTTRAVVSQVVNDTRPSRQEILPGDGGVGYRAFVLMQQNVGRAQQAMAQRIRNDQAMYTRFRATQAFEELDRQVRAYEESQRAGNP